jgi:hypothetical protein
MLLSERMLKWMMRLYPPLLFQRIWLQDVGRDFRSARIKVNKSLLTINPGKSIFGGTLFTAGDPFHAMLIGQIFRHKGYHITVWLKSAQITYLKPVREDCFYSIQFSETQISDMEQRLKKEGKFVQTFLIDMSSATGDCLVKMQNEIYVRDLKFSNSNFSD